MVNAQAWEALGGPQPLLASVLLSLSVTLSNLFDLLLLQLWGYLTHPTFSAWKHKQGCAWKTQSELSGLGGRDEGVY